MPPDSINPKPKISEPPTREASPPTKGEDTQTPPAAVEPLPLGSREARNGSAGGWRARRQKTSFPPRSTLHKAAGEDAARAPGFEQPVSSVTARGCPPHRWRALSLTPRETLTEELLNPALAAPGS